MKRVIIILAIFAICVTTNSQSWFRVESLPFNTKEYSEISPFLYNGKLIFCKNPKTKVFFTDLTPYGQPLFDIYTVEKLDDGNWDNAPTLFNEEMMATRYNEGSVTISSDGREIYFTRNISNSSREDNVFGIFRASLTRNGVTNVREFEYNGEDYDVCFPSISKDGKQLFFCSNMPGGSGGLDIYVCTRTRSTWEKPVNLGTVINTRRNEVYPFIHSSGRLYFSTDGYDNEIGQKDIYFSENINGTWQPPVNPGAPINSKRDDYSIFIDDDLRSGYFTTTRDRSPDIYYFQSTLPELDACKEVEKNKYCFTFFDEGAGTLDTTTLNYQWDLGDGTKIVGLEAYHCFDGPGEYEIKLNVIDALTGETYFNEATYDFPLEDIEQAYITCSDTVKVNSEVSFNGSKSYIKEFEIKQYIWDFGDLYQAVGENVNHIFKIPGQYTVKLGVTNGADNSDELLKSCSYKKITVLP